MQWDTFCCSAQWLIRQPPIAREIVRTGSCGNSRLRVPGHQFARSNGILPHTTTQEPAAAVYRERWRRDTPVIVYETFGSSQTPCHKDAAVWSRVNRCDHGGKVASRPTQSDRRKPASSPTDGQACLTGVIEGHVAPGNHVGGETLVWPSSDDDLCLFANRIEQDALDNILIPSGC